MCEEQIRILELDPEEDRVVRKVLQVEATLSWVLEVGGEHQPRAGLTLDLTHAHSCDSKSC